MDNRYAKKLDPGSRSYYVTADVMEMLGVSRDKAYRMIREVNDDMKKQGKMGKGYPAGRTPKWLFRKYYMLDPCDTSGGAG